MNCPKCKSKSTGNFDNPEFNETAPSKGHLYLSEECHDCGVSWQVEYTCELETIEVFE